MLGVLIVLVVVGSSIWVLADSRQIGAKKGLIRGFGDLGPTEWFIACLLLWIIAFPYYLTKRDEIRAAAGHGGSAGHKAGETEKRCPYCAETVLRAAIKCKHCGSDLVAEGKA